MVLGIGEGSIEIITYKPSYSAGEKIKGRVRLILNQPKKARGLRLRFYGVRRLGRGQHESVEFGYVQEIQLGGEKEYPAGPTEYDFELQLPIPGQPVAGMIPNAPWADEWYLDAVLMLWLMFGISKKLRINITR
jgi:hypothetical protein